MKASMIASSTVALAVVTTLAAHGQTPYAGGDPRQGRAFALEVCTPCHVVSKDQLSPPRFSDAPAFAAIANAPGMTAMSLAAFLGSPHPSMPNLILSADEQRDVIRYILSLQRTR